jgi:hypothetical protein
MGRSSKKIYWAATGAIFLTILLIALAFIVPRIVDSAWLKETIRIEVAKQVSGELDFRKAELAILPVPSVSLQKVSLVIPETARIHLDTLTVYPKLFPLLVGNIAISKVVVETPDFSLPLPPKPEKKTGREKDFSFSDVLDYTATKLTPILAAIKGLNAGVHNGTLRLFTGNDAIFLLENINGSFAVSSNALTSTLSCNSNIWETMELQATFAPVSREGSGRISLKNINAKVVAEYFLQEKLNLLEKSLTSLEAGFAVNPESGLTADIKSFGSSFAVLRENENITVKIGNFKGSIQYSDQISGITVDDATFSYPQVQLSGSYTFDRSIPQAVLDIRSQNANITGVREVLPVVIKAFYDDLSVVREIFDIFRGGTVTLADLHVEGKSPSDLAVFDSMRIDGLVRDGEVLLSDLDLDLQGVTGNVIIKNGILEGENLQARLGKSTGSNGSLKLGLVRKETTPFHLDLELIADLAAVPPLLKKLLQEKQVLEFLSLFESVEGTGQGRLILGESLESLSTRIALNTISVQINFKPIPYPLTINGGRILIEGLKTESFALQGEIGKSTFSNYFSRINFEAEPTIEVESGSFHMVLDEIFPWLASDKRLEDDLKDIQNITGIAEITVRNIQGPLLRPADLQYELHCDLKNIDLAAAALPGPLMLKSGKAEIVPDRALFENLHADLLDSSLTYSGILQNFINGKTTAEIIITDAEIGPQVNAWLSERLTMPEEYIFRTPLLVSRSNVKWSREELLDLQGDFSIKDGPIFSIDIMLNPDELVLRNLSLKNGDERANIRLALEQRKIGAAFQGSLSKNTIDKILVHNDAFPGAWIKGDILFHIDMDSPGNSSASGTLDGGDFIFPWKLAKPLLLENFSISASDKTLLVDGTEAVFEGRKYELNGQAVLAQERLSLDFDVSTDSVALDEIIAPLQKDEEQKLKKRERIGKDWDVAVETNINLHAESLQFKNYTWQPFESQITYEDTSLGIEVLKAELCNISTPGKISFHDGRITMDISVEAKEQELKEVLVCLEGGTQQMTGIMDLKANLSGQGTRDTLVNSIEGSLQYSAKDGYIYHDAQMAKLISFLNATDMFRGRIPDLRTAGFHYDSLIVKASMDKGILTITRAKLEAPIMQIAANGIIDLPGKKVDLQVLVAPLQTVNKIQGMLPIIRTILPTSLAALPVKVSGNFSDIRVRALTMSAITGRVFNVMMETLSTPVRILEEAQ